MIAPPAMPMISNADPILINLPSPAMAKGKIAGHMSALANPNKAIKTIEVKPLVANTQMVKIIPKMADSFNPVCCEIIFGMVKIPMI